MAGHSKFKNIMHRKGRADAQRSKLFSKLSRDITVAAKSGLPDPAANPRLRLAVNNAKAESLPKDVIQRAINKAAGGDVDTMEEVRYEGRGPGGVGIIVEALTDNRNRAASNIGEDHLELRSTLMRHAVTEHRDFRLLEADFVASGGLLSDIQSAPKNVGSEALSAWMFHEASKPDPFGLLGAMFVIEGLGSIKAAPWGRLVKERLNLPDEAVRFLLYHGDNDAEHMKEFEEMLGMVLPDPFVAERIVTTAKVTARLYALQIEEIAA